ncbi:diaminopimelate epimerase [Aquirufa sp.]|jgi:diaminopimelate epimerase|uniref:diaminopimelate epimerase n=1 Tax=Aquirufa sp. TaxID=2676249 RepID=UPI0037BE302D
MQFYKYQGTGNDFIIIDDRSLTFQLDTAGIAQLCHRRFGIGADGLMLLQNETGYDFRMVYFNADGTEGTMCGNGGRCLVQFAAEQGIVQEKAHFIAMDGPHLAHITPETISLQMQDVANIAQHDDDYFTNTGSPHVVRYVQQVQFTDVKNIGAAIRYSEAYLGQNGTNVNFAEKLDPQTLFVRTYERGVEDETYSCGTGVTAAALVSNATKGMSSPIQIKTLGGELAVQFEGNSTDGYTQIFLIGPAKHVFTGEI